MVTSQKKKYSWPINLLENSVTFLVTQDMQMKMINCVYVFCFLNK